MRIFLSLLLSVIMAFAIDFTFTKAYQAFNKGIRLEKTNPQKAQIYFQRAYVFLSEIKNPSSQKYYILGRMYCNGWGVPKNYQKAEEYFKKAIQLGNERAHCCIARLYIRMGRYKEAKKYLNYAMSHETLSHYCNDINPKTLKEIK
jgi:tetratricopeptide (TPR) repeat protein